MTDPVLLGSITGRVREYRARIAQIFVGEDRDTAETVAATAERVVQLAEAGDENAAYRATLAYSRQVTDSPFPLPVDVTRSLSFAVEAVGRALQVNRIPPRGIG